jgi:DNA-binding FadR family transcriptional regulator
MFKEVKQSRAFEGVFTQIQEMILQGQIKAGDKLPSERQLQETFKVSRGTLREAFRSLEQRGLIRIKTGITGGAIVCAIDTKGVSESLDLLLRYRKITLEELAEFREEVEGLVAAKAAQKASKVDKEQLNLRLMSIKNLLNADVFDLHEIVKEDNTFHLFLTTITGNKIFESVLSTVYENIYPYFDRFLPKDRSLMEKNYHDLCEIVDAIEKGDSKRAQVTMVSHIRYFNQIMEKTHKVIIGD